MIQNESSANKEQSMQELKGHVADYYHNFLEQKKFIPGESPIPVSGKVYGPEELQMILEAALDCWWTEGRFSIKMQDDLAKYIGVKYALLCNSGSSANLLAFSALTSPQLGERRLQPGDEVIGVAAGFPTTINPILQYGCIPVLLDIEIGTYNIDVTKLAEAITPKTKAIMLAHTLGNPWNIDAVMTVAKKHNLWVIEDCCDALGATYNGQKVGTFGDIGTLSFYPAHHITCGEGGAVFTNNPTLKRVVASIRDWGRDCWCMPGKDNTCCKRFLWQLGKLPYAYDHKYIYSHIGYNLKTTDLQAALLQAQFKRLPGFIHSRKNNFAILHAGLKKYEKWLVLPHATEHSDPSWFGFLITVQKDAGFSRAELVAHLEKNKIATRMLFAGNITKQPSFAEANYRVVGDLENTDYVMTHTFWVGVWPGITNEMYEYMFKVFDDFFVNR